MIQEDIEYLETEVATRLVEAKALLKMARSALLRRLDIECAPALITHIDVDIQSIKATEVRLKTAIMPQPKEDNAAQN